jgi:hypothetical protein
MASLIERLLYLMTDCAVFFWFLVMTGSAALFCGDKFSMFSDIGMAGAALYFLFNQMLFMKEIKAKNLSVYFFDSSVAVRALSWHFFS